MDRNTFYKNYPFITSAKVRWSLIFGISLFVLFFTSLFQPFYLRTYSLGDKILVISSWTIITFVSLFFNLFILPKIFPKLFMEKDWKVINEIFWITYNVFFVAFGCFLFKIFAGFYELSVERIFYGILATIAVGLTPAVIYVLIRQHFITLQQIHFLEQKRLISLVNDKIKAKVKTKTKNAQSKRKQEIALGDPEKEIRISSERDEKSLEIKAKNLVYVTSDKNYIELNILTGNNIRVFRIRNRMSIILELFSEYPHIQRTHRAFIVNLQYSQKIIKEGNTHKIILKNGEKIPVSRTYWNAVLDYLGG